MAKRNVNYVKPEDPAFLKAIKKQAGYDDRNPKFDKLLNSEEDFAEDTESEKPQVVVMSPGDLTAEEAELEMKRIEKEESEKKADLSKKVIFQRKNRDTDNNKRKHRTDLKTGTEKKSRSLLSFGDEEDDS
ncbi:Uncharacterized protein KIAA1143 homolog [Eumeta japonica]|uniref:Uncharacterized protein KIAA1143 homolog n=1 Tax=Eumeta variegata TaxID=151549 RepID=A0A4C1VST9_EUMVA|nr:Uncharacterized protein KIAA1143 homolog [Eumeta japonica]